ncbi:M3 family oligoendopeptidase [Pikeienuella piscinae]|uniref:M3 family oligoendopeptidase n=2 Tax=Pikeienuella piscinae TaxID=2748098 RepID=A0A7M3T796_9RHOB|nr:M3 family oligoendopeptidase [Pikeienuella piscinae]QIE57877.1 M3 family oligoendopeptidase [Pikeienuella piscinae]
MDSAEPSGGGALGELPEWRLDDLYPGMESDELEADFDWLETEIPSFAADAKGLMAEMDGDALARILSRYETIQRKSGRIMSYAGLLYQQNTAAPERGKFYADCESKLTDLSNPLVFFSLELNRIDDAALEGKLAESPALARYRPWLERLRSFRPHQLSDELETYQHDMSPVGASAWNKLFDETMAGLEFEIEGEAEPLNLEATLNLLSNPKRERRAAGAAALSKVFRANIGLFARITNTLAKEKEIEDRWRKLPKPESARHLANHVEPEVVDALRDAVVAAYPSISHRYYALKAKWLGHDKLQHWDRNAPLPEADDRKIPWAEAKETVLSAYAGFDPKMAEIAAPFFEKGWIDAPVKPGKAPGAFAHPTVTDAHPYVMLNYLGKTRDVMTLAHELGHGVHQVLAAGQGELLSHTPLTLAETASVFGEMLTFKKLLAAAGPERRRALLAGKVEDMINTVVRQIAFYEFELRVHTARREGELTREQLCDIWMGVQRESLGPVFEFAEGYETYWTYIPHFIHSPFYVYAYAFGDGLVNALYAVYEEAPEGFQQKYFDMLAAGGSKHHKALLAPFGLDATDPAFWGKGLGVISAMIDELEAMEG